MNEFFSVLIGLLVRLAIPATISIVVFFFLRRLDERWQKEVTVVPVLASGQRPCWEIKNCSEEKRKNCAAAKQSNVPCWHTFRSKDGLLKESCLDCNVFRQAKVPVHS